MPAALADSALHRPLFGDEATAALFTDSAEIRAMLLVEGALARVQGRLGLIPETAAAAIDRASREVQIDPAALGPEAAVNGVPVPGLVAAFRKAMQAPEHAQYLHWGATSQDIVDTALTLRLRRVTQDWDARLGRLIAALGALAGAHADLPMAARVWPNLTSVRLPIRDMGRMAAEKLLAPMRGVDAATLKQDEVRPALVVRKSAIEAV